MASIKVAKQVLRNEASMKGQIQLRMINASYEIHSLSTAWNPPSTSIHLPQRGHTVRPRSTDTDSTTHTGTS